MMSDRWARVLETFAAKRSKGEVGFVARVVRKPAVTPSASARAAPKSAAPRRAEQLDERYRRALLRYMKQDVSRDSQ
jgi:hypothetical protein